MIEMRVNRFGWTWLRRLLDGITPFTAYQRHKKLLRQEDALIGFIEDNPSLKVEQVKKFGLGTLPRQVRKRLVKDPEGLKRNLRETVEKRRSHLAFLLEKIPVNKREKLAPVGSNDFRQGFDKGITPNEREVVE